MPTNKGSPIAASQYAKTMLGSKPSNIVFKTRWQGITSDNYFAKKEKKKMGWFRKKFNGWVRQAWNDATDVDEVAVKSPNNISGKSSVRFTVYAASGGFIIEHYKQDRYRESDGPELTIVNNGESLGTAVEHILTMEALKA